MLSAVLLGSGTSALLTTPAALSPSPVVQRHGPPLCSFGDDGAATRRAVLSAGAAAALSLMGASEARAGYVTSLGSVQTSPKDAERDEDLMGSESVKKSLESVKSYKAFAANLKTKFAGDTNMQLVPAIRAEFDFSKVRDDLNVLTAVFDDTTQLTTDRLSRAILYDLTELENASRFKKGDVERTPKKIANVDKWFGKLDTDFKVFLEYF